MKEYRKASTEEELNKVELIPYDRNFFNVEDPKVFKDLMIGKNRNKIWKRTYGFDFVSVKPSKKQPVKHFSCMKYCLKSEFGNFAKQCRKKGGLFKCCQVK